MQVLYNMMRGKNHEITYLSLLLNLTDASYSATHLETVAVVCALEYRHVILGYPITVYTDHPAVNELLRGQNLRGKLAGWYLTIQ